MRVSFRSAVLHDFEYCAKLYYAGRERAIREEGLDMALLLDDLRRRWDVGEVRILVVDGEDVGWLQSRDEGDALFVVQLFVATSFQGRGVGTETMRRVVSEAQARDVATRLGVVKTNPALRLYSRLGFQITHEDERKFYMTREIDVDRSAGDRSEPERGKRSSA